MARPEGLEPPAYWFEAKNARRINNLAADVTVAHRYQSVFVFKQYRQSAIRARVTVSNGAMQGVGTNLGTVSGAPYISDWGQMEKLAA